MPVIADFLLVALSLLAPALGGSTFLWAQALLFLLAGFIIFAHPSRHRLPKPILIAFAALVGMALMAFLPAIIFNFPWRTEFAQKYEAPVGKMFTVQPFLTLEDTTIMTCTLVWASYVITRGLTVRRRTLMGVYAAGIIGLTIVAFFLYGKPNGLWQPLNGKFGFFPNRNHTANVLVLGGIVTMALAYDAFLKGRKVAWFWASGYLLIAVGLVVNFSRAGIIFFFLGSAAWFGWVTWKTREFKRMAVGSSILLFFLAAFLLFGGRTAGRFVGNTDQRQDLRIPLHRDALTLIKDTWWHGVGLGNFEPVFAGYRKYSGNFEARALHPESDWLQGGIELGALAPMAVMGALGFLLWKRWPRPGEGSFHLRAAAAVGVLVFAVHGVVDVPGHVLGALFPALFLVAMTDRDELIDEYRPWLGKLYRGAAFLMCVVGLAWLMDCFGSKRLPTSAAVFATKQEIIAAYDNRRHSEVISLASKGLEIVPADWYFYYNRGLAQAWILATPERAIADLGRAYYLERLSSDLPFTEGRVWLNREPELAVQAWNRALQLVDRSLREDMFATMLLESLNSSETRKWLRQLAVLDMNHFLLYLGGANPQEFKMELAELRKNDPDLAKLTDPQRRRLFELWRTRGDVAEMAEVLKGNAAFSAVGWMPLAEAMATRKEFQQAYELAFKNAPVPSLPKSIKQGTSEELLRAVLFEKDFVAGYALYYRYLTEGKPEEALKTLRTFVDSPTCPKYFHYLTAMREAEIFEWEKAWRSLHKYLEGER
jgi:hypothetical protein